MLPKLSDKNRRDHAPTPLQERLRAFLRDDDGALIVFTLYILLCMLMAIGMAIDTVRTENRRIMVQNTIDGAVLASADLEQTLDPKEAVYDRLARIGLKREHVTVNANSLVNDRIVSAQTNIAIPTLFMDLVGVNSLPAAASGTARESVTDLEIALVLDNSGSMSFNDNFRMDLLKPAAKRFVDIVLGADTADKQIAISIVPFATQVSVGDDLLSHYTGVSDEHSYSDCVTFEDSDFRSVDLPKGTALARTAHFDVSGSGNPASTGNRVCSVWSSRKILPWSNNATALKAHIDSMTGRGWTSIELGAKWGTTLLDPSSRTVLTSMADKNLVLSEFKGQPFDYRRNGTQKFLVIMSDGENTRQFDIKAPYREGPSTLYKKKGKSGESRSHYVFYDEDRSSSKKYYRFNNDGGGKWHSKAAKDPSSVSRMTWPEVWDQMAVEYYTDKLADQALGVSSDTLFDRIVMEVNPSSKNTRTSQICKAAKEKGVIIYTIGMDTYGQGDATLKDCATDEATFFDVQSKDIQLAFESIARTITQLRLTN